MAFSTRSSLFFFFFLTLVLFSIQINARDSYSFGKFQRENPKDQNPNNNLVPIQTNETNEQDDQNPAFIPQTENGYGLYSHETPIYNNNEELNNKKYDENVNNFDDSFSTPSLTQTQESYKNYDDSFSTPSLSQTEQSYKNYEENYPKTTESYDNNKDTSYFENSNGYGTGKREKEAYKGYRNNVERQGLSDTRFMANGNYYYDLDDDRNHGRFYNKHYYNNYNPTGYNERESNFKNPYNSKNMMNQQSQMFGEEQADQFAP